MQPLVSPSSNHHRHTCQNSSYSLFEWNNFFNCSRYVLTERPAESQQASLVSSNSFAFQIVVESYLVLHSSRTPLINCRLPNTCVKYSTLVPWQSQQSRLWSKPTGRLKFQKWKLIYGCNVSAWAAPKTKYFIQTLLTCQERFMTQVSRTCAYSIRLCF